MGDEPYAFVPVTSCAVRRLLRRGLAAALDTKTDEGKRNNAGGALGILSGGRRVEREDLVPRAEGADQEEFGIEHRYGDEVVTDLGNAINKK
jgi:hypothetical protein